MGMKKGSKRPVCECSDRECPAHEGRSECTMVSVGTLYRCDMEDRTGTPMCRQCKNDAYESGLFSAKP